MSSHHANRTPIVIAAIVVVTVLAGCAAAEYDETADWSKKHLFREAEQSLDEGSFKDAIDYFEKLEARYPFDPLALQAQLDLAYAYYEYGEEGSAISTLDRFIRVHPSADGIAYAYYMRGLVRYNRGRSFINDLFPRDMSEMEQGRLHKAFSDFRTVVRQYGDSRYADDAQQRMVYLRNQMAKHEFKAARFNFRNSAYTGALNRITYLLGHYDGAPVIPDAIALQARAYDHLGLKEQAKTSRQLLQENWPDHPVPADESDQEP